jgi:ubiquinone/menaquinone biosynthesis C-methylase UbiE
LSLTATYRLVAPFYDLVARPLFEGARHASLARLPRSGDASVLLDGVGTGLDLAHLPRGHAYTALDLTPAMMRRARARAGDLHVRWVQGDAMQLPFADAAFDHVVLHLILAVVPDGRRALAEALRVVKPGGRLLVLDKFLRPGERAPLRRLLAPFTGRLVTRTDVVFEDLLAHCRNAEVSEDEPLLAGGWFRRIVVTRTR